MSAGCFVRIWQINQVCCLSSLFHLRPHLSMEGFQTGMLIRANMPLRVSELAGWEREAGVCFWTTLVCWSRLLETRAHTITGSAFYSLWNRSHQHSHLTSWREKTLFAFKRKLAAAASARAISSHSGRSAKYTHVINFISFRFELWMLILMYYHICPGQNKHYSLMHNWFQESECLHKHGSPFSLLTCNNLHTFIL